MRIFLGTTMVEFKRHSKTRFYIEKHKWECEWYWAFGYIGNAGMHTHFESVFLGVENNVDKIFIKPRYTQDEWWVIRDLFIQAYALKEAANVYQHGGHQTNKAHRLPNNGASDKLNKDLGTILDKLWEVLANEKFFEKGE